MSFIEHRAFAHGKHEGRQVHDVVREDPAYLHWVLNTFDDLESDEKRVIQSALESLEADQELEVEEAQNRLHGLFIGGGDADFQWTDEQFVALDEIDAWRVGNKAIFALTGPAGTGKSTLLREVVRRYPSTTFTAMTGKAALRLSQATGCSASTLHSALYYPPKPGEDLRFVRLREPPSKFVAIDESSQITPQIFRDLKQWVAKGAKILFVGDSYQLPPVITGKELQEFGEDYSVFAQVPGTALKTVMRNAGGVLRAATRVRETGEICAESDEGYQHVKSSSPIERAVEDYLADREDHLLITWKNAVRMSANRMIRERLGHEGPLPDDGEPVLIKKNGQGFLNGEIVECGGFEMGPRIGSIQTLRMRIGIGGNQTILVSHEGSDESKGGEPFDGAMPWIRDWKAYHIDLRKGLYPEPSPVTFGYCHTCHSAQGSQARRTTVFLCRGDDRSRNFRKSTTLPSGDAVKFSTRWIYTAITRSTQQTTLIVG